MIPIKSIIRNHLETEWKVTPYSFDFKFENIVIFEPCRDWIGLVLIFFDAFKKNGEYKTISKIEELKNIEKDLEEKGFQVKITDLIPKAKQVIEHYFILKAYLEPKLEKKL